MGTKRKEDVPAIEVRCLAGASTSQGADDERAARHVKQLRGEGATCLLLCQCAYVSHWVPVIAVGRRVRVFQVLAPWGRLPIFICCAALRHATAARSLCHAKRGRRARQAGRAVEEGVNAGHVGVCAVKSLWDARLLIQIFRSPNAICS